MNNESKRIPIWQIIRGLATGAGLASALVGEVTQNTELSTTGLFVAAVGGLTYFIEYLANRSYSTPDLLRILPRQKGYHNDPRIGKLEK